MSKPQKTDLAAALADRIRQKQNGGRPQGRVDYRRMSRDLLAAVKEGNETQLADILEAHASLGGNS
jgi:hypothetical protein